MYKEQSPTWSSEMTKSDMLDYSTEIKSFLVDV